MNGIYTVFAFPDPLLYKSHAVLLFVCHMHVQIHGVTCMAYTLIAFVHVIDMCILRTYCSLNIIMGTSNDFVILMLSVNNRVSHIVRHYEQIYLTVATPYNSG